jgi:hypothetical protein
MPAIRRMYVFRRRRRKTANSTEFYEIADRISWLRADEKVTFDRVIDARSACSLAQIASSTR